MSRTGLFKVALVAGMLAFSACAQESGDNPFMIGAAGGEDEPEAPDELRQVVDGAFADVEAFWSETFPDVYGGAFQPVEGYYPYGPSTDMPPCGEPRPSYEDIAENAFYCPESDIIAADEVNLLPGLSDEFGGFTIGIVFAHEYGHAIQARASEFSNLSVVVEMQADCFAGAWTAWVADGNSDNFKVEESQLDLSMAGMISISDAPGTTADDLAAHGSGFDRVGSFQDGFDNGAVRCSEYDSDPNLPIVEMGFTDDEFATGGNLHPFDEGPDDPGLLSLAEQDLNDFYEQLFQEKFDKTWEPVSDLVVADDDISCNGNSVSADDIEFDSGYCEDENVAVIGKELVPALNDMGDFALAAEVARLWAEAAQLQLGIDGEDKQASLHADCLTGFWAYARFPIDENGNERTGLTLTISPGDLDEGILGFLYGGAQTSAVGTAFERVAALRAGFLNGVDGCDAYT
jgi:predicted metalloprotease